MEQFLKNHKQPQLNMKFKNWVAYITKKETEFIIQIILKM